MPINNLPPFRERASFPPPNVAGQWVKAPASLKQLGQSLQVDEDRPEASQSTIIRAIPDPWAQARTFAEAVLDEDHSMHKAAIGQWRGLLALFALAELRKTDYSLDVKPLELTSDHPLDRVLRHLSPTLAIGDNAGLWLKPHIVYIQPRRGRPMPIALLNPASLISPGRTSWQLPFDFIPWMRQGLSDPLRLTGDSALANTQFAALAAYLRNVRESVPVDGGYHGSVLRQVVQDYIDAVEDRMGDSPLTAKVKGSPDSALPGLYQSLALTAELNESIDPAMASECRVRLLGSETGTPFAAAASVESASARDAQPNAARFKGVILIDESLTRTLRRATRDIIVWGNDSLSDVLGSPNKLQDVQSQAANLGWLVVTVDDLFTPRLVRLRKDPKIEGHSADMRDMLEPIRPLVLLLDQAGTRVLDVDRGDRRAVITLHLKLETAGGATSIHALSRTYRTDEGHEPRLVDEVDWDFGQTSIWPNFRSTQWPYYFARLTYPTTREQIRPQFAMSRAVIEAAVAESATAGQAIQTLQAINRGRAPAEKATWFRRTQNLVGKAYEELQTSDKPFEVVFYVDYHPDRGEAPAGCVRLKLIELAGRDTKASVAVDFGSTNSVACISGSVGRSVTLQGRIVHPIMFQDAARNDEWKHIVRWQYVDFLPVANRDTPTPTVVISRNDADRNADLWLHRNLIYFQPAGNPATGSVAAEIKNLEVYLKRSHFDLKWNEDPEHIDASSDFLEQFMTMVAAEAAAADYNPRRIEWHFSVPDAMQGTRLSSFRQQVEVARNRLSPEGKLHDLYSEGMAAARYILSGREGAKFTQGTVNAILDIGGSTTDITLWANDIIVWKGSFRLAGRAFFTETLVQNPQILRDIELVDWADLLDPDRADRVPQENVADVGELLFSRPALGEAFDKHWHRRLNVKTGEVLRSTALIYLSGIAWYLGLVARGLVDEKILTEADLLRPAFALCGRGAGIFNRMHGGQAADSESQVTQSLRTFSQAAGIAGTPRPQLFISKQPKLEVAAGMMVSFDAIDARVGNGTPKSTFTPAGLAVEFADGDVLKADQPIGAPSSHAVARGSDLAELSRFLDALQELSSVSVDLHKGAGQGAFYEISTVVRQKVDRQKNTEGELLLTEPPFITALGALVAIMASPKSERDTKMSVKS